jgi:uncharacterized membrane protein YheB (UPF0754 family)
MFEILTDVRLWQYLSIPVIAALIGWTSNWLAIQMTFYPVEFVGKPPLLGWQGIIPSKARKMATISVDSTIARLGTVDELLQQMNPRLIAEYIVQTVDPRLEEYVDEVMLQEHPTIWENLPARARQLIVDRVRESMPERVNSLVAEISANIENLLDLKTMVTDRLVKDKHLLNRIFQECGEREFRFIIKSGLYFGFIFGLIQMAAWYFFQHWWILPLFGLLVGWTTNWLALNLIFRPLKPIRIGPFVLQGLFLRRQREVAASFCHIVTHEVLTVGNLARALVDGANGERARNMIRKHIKPIVDETTGLIRPFTQLALGPKGFATIKARAGELAVDMSADTFTDPIFERERAAAVERIMRERMETLPPPEFQDLLRPCFQEDETKLIMVGAALGCLAGLAQVIFVFGELL